MRTVYLDSVSEDLLELKQMSPLLANYIEDMPRMIAPQPSVQDLPRASPFLDEPVQNIINTAILRSYKVLTGHWKATCTINPLGLDQHFFIRCIHPVAASEVFSFKLGYEVIDGVKIDVRFRRADVKSIQFSPAKCVSDSIAPFAPNKLFLSQLFGDLPCIRYSRSKNNPTYHYVHGRTLLELVQPSASNIGHLKGNDFKVLYSILYSRMHFSGVNVTEMPKPAFLFSIKNNTPKPLPIDFI
jgi:hypothetical protein